MTTNYQYYEWSVKCIDIINKELGKRRLLAGIVVLYNLMKFKKKKRQFWIAEMFKNRKRYGFYHAILPSVRLEDLRFKNYTRMTTIQFEELLLMIGSDLKKQYVVREPINEEQRLIVTLRYLQIKIMWL